MMLVVVMIIPTIVVIVSAVRVVMMKMVVMPPTVIVVVILAVICAGSPRMSAMGHSLASLLTQADKSAANDKLFIERYRVGGASLCNRNNHPERFGVSYEDRQDRTQVWQAFNNYLAKKQTCTNGVNP
jgi:hypothetical protein